MEVDSSQVAPADEDLIAKLCRLPQTCAGGVWHSAACRKPLGCTWCSWKSAATARAPITHSGQQENYHPRHQDRQGLACLPCPGKEVSEDTPRACFRVMKLQNLEQSLTMHIEHAQQILGSHQVQATAILHARVLPFPLLAFPTPLPLPLDVF